MKKTLLLWALCALSVAAYAAPASQLTVALADAVWNFDDGTAQENTRPVLTNASFACPNSWVSGTAGSSKAANAYLPFIYPSFVSDPSENVGYDGLRCFRVYGIASAGRVPTFAVLPLISDAKYDTLKLCFYGKQEASITSTPYYGHLRIGYITSLDDTLKANFPTGIHNFMDTTLGTSYVYYEIPLNGIPEGARVVLYDDDATVVNSCLLDNISFQGTGATPEPANPTITCNLTHYTAVPGNPTSIIDDETDELNLAFVLEDGYKMQFLSVTLGGVAVDDLMQNYYADPYYYTQNGHDTLYLTIGAMEDYLNADIVVTLVGEEIPAPAVTPIPGAATFEEYLAVLPQSGDKYDPNTTDGTSYWQSGDYSFSCTSSWGGMMHDGFYAANYKDTTYTTYTDDYKALPCSGAEGSSAYCSMYYGGSYGGPCTIKCSERTISGTYITMAINPYLCIHGRSWCAAFANGDYLYLHMMGKKNGVYTGTSVDFYLADYRNGNTLEVTDWTWCDLTGLGLVDEVEVVMYDSQSGAGVGLYACFDNFGGIAPAVTAISNQQSAISSQKLLWNNQIVIRRGEHIYNLNGIRLQ